MTGSRLDTQARFHLKPYLRSTCREIQPTATPHYTTRTLLPGSHANLLPAQLCAMTTSKKKRPQLSCERLDHGIITQSQ